MFNLFWTFFCIGMLCFGGGYAAIQIIQEQTVYLNSWLTLSEFAQIEAIAEMTPGPLALNASSFIGAKMYGWTGSIIATLGLITPPTLISYALAYYYQKNKNSQFMQTILNGIKPAIIGMIASVALLFIDLAIDLHDPHWPAFFFMVLLIVGLYYKKLGPISTIVSSGMLYVIIELFQ